MALLHAFREAMRRLGVRGRLLATDVTEAAAAFHSADRGFLAPRVGDPDYIPALKRVCAEEGVGLLIPLTDLDLLVLAERRDEFAAAGCRVMIGPPETVRQCTDKSLTPALLERIGLRAIRTLALDEFRRRPFYPCFVKPRHGSASIGAAVVCGAAELESHLAGFADEMVVQELVGGREYTLDIYRTREGKVAAVVPRQRLEIRAGEVAKGVTVRDEELIASGVRLGEGLEGLWGVVNAQCRRAEGGPPCFFEVNPRFGGGAPLAIAAGVDLPGYVLAECLGRPVEGRAGEFTPNLLMLRYDEAVFVSAKDPSTLPGFESPLSR